MRETEEYELQIFNLQCLPNLEPHVIHLLMTRKIIPCLLNSYSLLKYSKHGGRLANKTFVVQVRGLDL